MRRLFAILTFFGYLVAFPVSAQKGEHTHSNKKEKEPAHSDHHKHEEEEHDEHANAKSDEHDRHQESHEHGKAEGHDEHEESSQVGPDKGILEANESQGFKLSPEAEKNFGLSRVKVTGTSVELPRHAIVTAVAEVNVFRYRSGYYKRIDYKEIGRSEDKISIQSEEIKPDDEIVVQGLGFLRIAEIAAFGGAPEGHSH